MTDRRKTGKLKLTGSKKHRGSRKGQIEAMDHGGIGPESA